MQVDLLYGRGTLPIRLPDDLEVTVVRKPAMPVLDDPPAAVARALAARSRPDRWRRRRGVRRAPASSSAT